MYKDFLLQTSFGCLVSIFLLWIQILQGTSMLFCSWPMKGRKRSACDVFDTFATPDSLVYDITDSWAQNSSPCGCDFMSFNPRFSNRVTNWSKNWCVFTFYAIAINKDCDVPWAWFPFKLQHFCGVPLSMHTCGSRTPVTLGDAVLNIYIMGLWLQWVLFHFDFLR